MNDSQSISQFLKNILPEFEDPPVEPFLHQKLLDYWREHSGTVAPHTYPLLYESGRLVIFCDSAVWATQIRHQTPSLLRQLNEQDFNISKIKTRIRPVVTIRDAIKSKPKSVNAMSNNNAIAMRNLAKNLKHKGLRKSLHRLSKKPDEQSEKE